MPIPTVITVYTILLTILLFSFLKDFNKSREELEVSENLEGDLPSVSVIVPLRNEERNARRCIQSLLSQTYPNFEVIAVDDRSTDNTLNILKELACRWSNLKVIKGVSTPDGWVGKNHALWQGVKESKADWLLFVDADTSSEPFMLTSVMKHVLENKIDMFSVSTFQVMETFWERVVQTEILSSIYRAYPQSKINDPKSKLAAANGQFILIRRSVYEAISGHLAVKDKIVEDFALANLVKGSGYKLRVARATKLIRTRMYTNFQEIWEGWTKNLFFGLGKRWSLVSLSIVILLARGIVPPVLFVWSFVNVVFLGARTPATLLIFGESIFLLALIVYLGWQTTRFFAVPRYYSFSFPLGAAMYIAIILSSAYKVVSGRGVTWKERVYRL